MYDFINTNKRTFCKLGKILFIIFAIDSIALYFYNLITVGMEYGIGIIWQPLVSNVNSLGLGIIYLIISYMFAKHERMLKNFNLPVSREADKKEEPADDFSVAEECGTDSLIEDGNDTMQSVESVLDSEEYN